jgi:hypothetical protein
MGRKAKSRGPVAAVEIDPEVRIHTEIRMTSPRGNIRLSLSYVDVNQA